MSDARTTRADAAWRQAWQGAQTTWAAWGGVSATRERRWVVAGVFLLLAFVLWQWTVSPAWQTLRRAPAQRAQLELELQQMQALAREAAQLRTLPTLGAGPAQAALKAATDRLGAAAKLTVQGDRAIVTLENVGSGALRAWLSEVRSGARGRPIQAQLAHTSKGFSGTLTVALPSAGGAP